MMTAEDFLDEHYYHIVLDSRNTYVEVGSIYNAMIDFATMHCEAQAKAILENVDWKETPTMQGVQFTVKKASVLNAYPLNLIK